MRKGASPLRPSRWLAVVGLIGMAVPGIVAAQRAPCANFDGPGRVPYCGGKPGVYAIVDTVTFEPSEGLPQRVRISGDFVIARPISSGLHRPPQRGYLYFSLPPEGQEAVRKDWSDLAALAGTGRVVGFVEYWVSRPIGPGDHFHENGVRGTVNSSVVVHVHTAGSRADPEPYPLPHERGVITSFEQPHDVTPRFGKPSAAIIAELQEVARR